MSKTMTNKEFNKSKEEKRQMFFDMQEHPDRYTDCLLYTSDAADE